MKQMTIILTVLFLLDYGSNAQPTQQWVASYDGPNTNTDRGYAVTADLSGNVYVTGQSRGNGTNADYATIKYNAEGVQQWVARYNGTGNSIDVAQAIAIDVTGNVYVTGYSRGSGTSDDYATIKYNSSGVQQWAVRYNGPWNFVDLAYSIAVDESGNVYVTGYSYGNAPSSDYLTIKYNNAGEMQWEARYDAAGHSDQASSLAIDESGNVYVTGYSFSSILGHADYATIKYNSAGVQQWVARYNGPADLGDQARQLTLDGEGNIYVTGFSATPDTLYDYATVKYDSTGNQQWAARYNGPDNLTDLATSIDVDNSGNVYVTGSSATEPNPVSNYDCATVKYSTSGVQQWVARYNGPSGGSDVALSIKADDFGNSYITGRSTGIGTGEDCVTLKYNSSGLQQWEERYNGPGNAGDEGTAMAIDGFGNIYVTGCNTNVDLDYTTIKYSDVPLPVTMSYFSSSLNGNSVTLKWGTMNEINNSGFKIERSNSEITAWSAIAFVQGYGTVNEEKHYVFQDNDLIKGRYKYRLKQIDYNGNFEYHALPGDVTIGAPGAFEITQNYPNPSNPKSKIDFQLPFDAQVTLKVYDITGKECGVLVNNFLTADYHTAEFDGSDLASGVYFYRITAEGSGQVFSKTMKMVLVK